jgi:hypothetical protein
MPLSWIQDNPTEALTLFKSLLLHEIANVPFSIPPSCTIYYSYFLPDSSSFCQLIDCATDGMTTQDAPLGLSSLVGGDGLSQART